MRRNKAAKDTSLNDTLSRSKAWFDMLVIDHGVLRIGYRHWKRVAPGVFRSNQPAPYQIRRAARAGIRSVVNLRGANDSGHYHLEKEACDEAGIELVDFPIKSRRAPPRQMVLDAAELFERIDHPVLIHCKSGIDRTGLMSAIYLLTLGEADTATALRQFSARYGYLGAGPTGYGKAFIEAYQAAQRESGAGFLDWVATRYDPEQLEKSFTPKALTTALANVVLRRE